MPRSPEQRPEHPAEEVNERDSLVRQIAEIWAERIVRLSDEYFSLDTVTEEVEEAIQEALATKGLFVFEKDR